MILEARSADCTPSRRAKEKIFSLSGAAITSHRSRQARSSRTMARIRSRSSHIRRQVVITGRLLPIKTENCWLIDTLASLRRGGTASGRSERSKRSVHYATGSCTARTSQQTPRKCWTRRGRNQRGLVHSPTWGSGSTTRRLSRTAPMCEDPARILAMVRPGHKLGCSAPGSARRAPAAVTVAWSGTHSRHTLPACSGRS